MSFLRKKYRTAAFHTIDDEGRPNYTYWAFEPCRATDGTEGAVIREWRTFPTSRHGLLPTPVLAEDQALRLLCEIEREAEAKFRRADDIEGLHPSPISHEFYETAHYKTHPLTLTLQRQRKLAESYSVHKKKFRL